MRTASFGLWLALLLCACQCVYGFKGDATAYSGPFQKDATGKNACGFGKLSDRFERFYGAMNTAQFGGSCGKCVRARGTEGRASGEWHLVKIVDHCPSCSHGDVDFSSTAFKAITGFDWDRKEIEWEWADCDGGDSQQERKKRERERQEREEAERKARQERERKERQQKKEQQEAEAEREQRRKEEAEAAARAQAERKEAERRQRAEQAQQEQAQAAPAAPSPASAPDAITAAAAASAEAAAAAPARRVTDWVLACEPGRRRCTNLHLAALGFQCMTWDDGACCQTGTGQRCRAIDSVPDDGQPPEGWLGREMVELPQLPEPQPGAQPARQPQPELVESPPQEAATGGAAATPAAPSPTPAVARRLASWRRR